MRATNHAGWAVQAYTKPFGWVPDGVTWATREEARADMVSRPTDGFERRVYEVLS